MRHFPLLIVFTVLTSISIGCSSPTKVDWDKILGGDDKDSELTDTDSGNSGDDGDTGNTGDSDNTGNTADTGDPENTDGDCDDDKFLKNDIDITDDEPSDDSTTEAVILKKYDFESGSQDWTHDKLDSPTSAWPFDMWEHGNAVSGPGSCYQGNGCYGFNLEGNYINCQRAQLISPVIDLSSYTGESLKIEFMHWYSFYSDGASFYDGGFVEFSVDGGLTWHPFSGLSYYELVKIRKASGQFQCENIPYYVDNKPGFVDKSDGWEKFETELTSSMLSKNFRLRFVFGSGVQKDTSSKEPSDYSFPGWYIDNIVIAKY